MATTQLGLSELFTGVILHPIIGNAAEHATAVTVALENKMDLSFAVAVGSSMQIALFVCSRVEICLTRSHKSHARLIELRLGYTGNGLKAPSGAGRAMALVVTVRQGEMPNRNTQNMPIQMTILIPCLSLLAVNIALPGCRSGCGWQ